MATAAAATSRAPQTLAELLHRLGDIPPERIQMRPYPGTAKVKDVVRALEAADKRLYELVEGVLVEKAMGLRESVYGNRISHRINLYLDRNDLGFVAGADGATEIMPNLVRIPDVSFVSWDDVSGGELPEEPVPELVPRLAVEVMSKGNTTGEMTRKLHDYFEAGVQLVWFIYPKTQSAEICTSPTAIRRVGKNQSLDGGNVLPGFKLPLKAIFQRPSRKPAR